MVKAVAYTRVSTEEQNPQSQLQVVLDYIRQRSYDLVKVFEEYCSGAVPPLNRPVFRDMLKFVKENDVDVIVLYDLTRFYRGESPVRALQMIRDIMDQYKVLIEFAREPEIEDPLLKELWLFIKSWFSTYERLQISLRTTYGLRRLKQEGKLYHKPSIVHYYASAIFGKDLSELTKEDVERAKKLLRGIVQKYWSGPYKKTKIGEILAQAELKIVYDKFPKAPKSYWAFRRVMLDH